MSLAYIFGIAVLVLIWLLTGRKNPWKLVEGADGRPSTSKLQWFLWTVVVIFSYTAISWALEFKEITDIPQNVLIAMGLSVTTMAAAKSITVSYIENKKIIKSADNKSSFVQDDEGWPDLSKVQMLAWTFIAIGFYLFDTIQIIQNPNSTRLPDISPALMLLMGLGQGAYLGKKLTTSTPILHTATT